MAPVAAASLGVVTPRKMKPITMKTMSAMGVSLAVIISFVLRGTESDG